LGHHRFRSLGDCRADAGRLTGILNRDSVQSAFIVSFRAESNARSAAFSFPLS
jgi:hypothetical protein